MISRKIIGWAEAVVHLLFWLGLFFLVFNGNETRLVIERVGEPGQTINTTFLLYLTYAISALIFYGNSLLLYPRIFKKGNIITYVIALILWSVGLSLAEYLYTGTLLHPTIVGFYSTALVNHIVFLLFSMVYVLIKNQSQQANMQREIKESQLVDELIFLKSQLNPHLLFNAINNIFSMAQKNNDDEVANYLADLSKIMRYSLYESNEVKVSLEKELNFLKSYVQMSMLKFTPEDIDLKIEIKTVHHDQRIAPLLLVPLIENAFKHGPLAGKRAEIDIGIQVLQEEMKVHVKNSLHRKTHTVDKEVGGIGLKNLKRRLELLYHDRHDLEVIDHGDRFEALLKIQFSGA